MAMIDRIWDVKITTKYTQTIHSRKSAEIFLLMKNVPFDIEIGFGVRFIKNLLRRILIIFFLKNSTSTIIPKFSSFHTDSLTIWDSFQYHLSISISFHISVEIPSQVLSTTFHFMNMRKKPTDRTQIRTHLWRTHKFSYFKSTRVIRSEKTCRVL